MYQIKILNCFKKQVKAYSKKFPALKQDMISELRSFRKEGSISLGARNYKIRIHSSDLRKGKSKAFRLILHVLETDKLLIPIALYFKGKQENISRTEINRWLQKALDELKSLQ